MPLERAMSENFNHRHRRSVRRAPRAMGCIRAPFPHLIGVVRSLFTQGIGSFNRDLEPQEIVVSTDTNPRWRASLAPHWRGRRESRDTRWPGRLGVAAGPVDRAAGGGPVPGIELRVDGDA